MRKEPIMAINKLFFASQFYIFQTYTSTTVCTTSTSALKVCTPSGRRRRSVVGGRGLFYSEQDAQAEEGSIFLPSPIK